MYQYFINRHENDVVLNVHRWFVNVKGYEVYWLREPVSKSHAIFYHNTLIETWVSDGV